MANAANRLAVLLEEWTVPPQETPQHGRGFDSGDDVAAWRLHTASADLVCSLDYTLQGMTETGEDVSMFLGALPRWYAAVNFAVVPWGSVQNNFRRVCPDHDVNLLKALGALLDAGRPARLSAEDLQTIGDSLNLVATLLNEKLDILPDDIRRYLFGLINRARMVLENFATYGEEAVRSVALELGGALVVQAEHVDSTGDKEAGTKVRSAAAKIMGPFWKGAAAKGGAELAAQAMKALGG